MHVSFYPVDLPLTPVMKWVSGAHVQSNPPFFDAYDVMTLLSSSQCERKLEDSSLPPSLFLSQEAAGCGFTQHRRLCGSFAETLKRNTEMHAAGQLI